VNDLDINLLIQTFNEKIALLMTELVVKETTIKQLNNQLKTITASLAPVSEKEVTKQNKNTKQSDDFQ
jgi:hypothetical protein